MSSARSLGLFSASLSFALLSPCFSAVAVAQSAGEPVALSSSPALSPYALSGSVSGSVEPMTNQFVVKFSAEMTEAGRTALLESLAQTSGYSLSFEQEIFESVFTVNLGAELTGFEQQELARSFTSLDGVVYAEPDMRLSATAARVPNNPPNDSRYADQWNLTAINAADAWQYATGDGVVVGIADEGRTAHPDLDTQTVDGYDFLNSYLSRDGDGWDDQPNDTGDWSDSKNSLWHGMHVAGIVAAKTDNGQGIAGVAPNAKIQHLRVMGMHGKGYISDIAAGLSWGAGAKVFGTPDNTTPSDVINLSVTYQSSYCPAILQEAIDSAYLLNVPVVVSAGNNNANTRGYAPANCDKTIAVGATNEANARASYSNWGSEVDLLAPGGSWVGVLSTVDSGAQGPVSASYGYMVGTSQAAPHVSGVIALMLERNPKLTVEQIRQILLETGTQVGAVRMLNAKAAVSAVTPVTYKRGPFIDVPADLQFAEEISWLAQRGITTGWSNGMFRPHQEVSREAVAAFLYRYAGSPAYTPPAVSPFKDVPVSHPFYREICWLAARGITTGWQDGTFRPSQAIDRNAFAAFLYRFAGSPAYIAPAKSRFTDMTPRSPFYKEVSWVAQQGISTGWQDGTFRPQDKIRRDAVAAFLYRYSKTA